VLTAEPLQGGAATDAWQPLAGRVERSRDAGPDSWTVVHASVASGTAPAAILPQASAKQPPETPTTQPAGEPAPAVSE